MGIFCSERQKGRLNGNAPPGARKVNGIYEVNKEDDAQEATACGTAPMQAALRSRRVEFTHWATNVMTLLAQLDQGRALAAFVIRGL